MSTTYQLYKSIGEIVEGRERVEEAGGVCGVGWGVGGGGHVGNMQGRKKVDKYHAKIKKTRKGRQVGGGCAL